MKRRNVFGVDAAWLLVGWVVIEVASTLPPLVDLRDWAPQLLALGLAYRVGEIHAWWGQKNLALPWLERAHHQHHGGLTFARPNTLSAYLHNDPRFPLGLNKLGGLP